MIPAHLFPHELLQAVLARLFRLKGETKLEVGDGLLLRRLPPDDRPRGTPSRRVCMQTGTAEREKSKLQHFVNVGVKIYHIKWTEGAGLGGRGRVRGTLRTQDGLTWPRDKYSDWVYNSNNSSDNDTNSMVACSREGFA